MNAAIVDGELLSGNALKFLLQSIKPDWTIKVFQSSYDFLECFTENPFDAIFCDISMPELDGLQLAKAIRKLHPTVNIIFVTALDEYALQAFDVFALDYLLKPINEARLLETLSRINPVFPSAKKRVTVQTFGNFEIFVDDTHLTFSRSKSKELLAYLIDRKGGTCTVAEIAAVLYEDKPYTRSLQNQIQTIISHMMHRLRDLDADYIIHKSRNNLSINIHKVDCDYYQLLDGDKSLLLRFAGEYLSNYSWSENTLGTLINMAKQTL